jgi:N-methylhydantoinase A
MRESVRTILSGPAGGAVGAHFIGGAAGHDRLVTFDMGGTSTDVALIDGDLPLTMESSIGGYPVRTPMIDIHTVGAGGGSIARLDRGGALTVGPESAGADPGPICYGRGHEITVTDANLFLGRLIPERFLGGEMRLDTEKLGAAMEDMARRAGLTPTALAEGILDVANASMERAIRVISVERGHDPREFSLFSFGGAGGLHAAFLARQLSMPHVFIPRNPGILSAVGMVTADVIRDASRTVMAKARDIGPEDMAAWFNDLEQQALSALADEGYGPDSVSHERFLDMRYEGQSFEITVPLTDDFTGSFEEEHERKYGYRNPGKALEVVTVRLRSRGRPEKPDFPESGSLTDAMPSDAVLGQTQTVFSGVATTTAVIDRERLLPGNTLRGPAILTEYTSTIVIPPFASGRVDARGNIILDIDPEDGGEF